MRSRAGRAAILASVAVGYFAVAELSTAAAAAHAVVSSVWIPSGVALFAMLRLGLWYWPAILAGAFAFNVSNGVPALASGVIGVGNTLEAVVGAYALVRFGGFRRELDRMRDVFALMAIAAVGGTLVSAVIGVSALRLSGDAPGAQFLDLFVPWWSGDAVGVLLVTPFLLVWSETGHHTAGAKRRPREMFVTLVLFSALVLAAFRDELRTVYGLFPAVFWCALRHGQRGAVTAVAIVAIVATLQVVSDGSPIPAYMLVDNLVQLQFYLLLLAVPSLLFAAAVSESHATEQRLQQQSDQLSSAQQMARLGSWHWDVARDRVEWSPQLRKIFGTSLDEPRTFAEHLAFVHPDDRDAVEAAVRGALHSGQRFECQHRFVRADGREGTLVSAGYATVGSSGTASAMLGIGHDVTERRDAERAARERDDLLRRVFDVNAHLASTLDLDRLFEILVVEGAAVVHASAACAGQRVGDEMVARRAHVAGASVAIDARWARGIGAPGALLETPEPVQSDDMETAGRHDAAWRARFVARSALATPILDAGGRSIAFLEVYRDRERPPFTIEDRLTLQALAHAAGSAVERALRVAQLERRTRELTQSEAQYRALAHDLPDAAVALFDRDFRLQVADGPVLERIGLSRELAEGRTLFEVLPSAEAGELARRFAAVFEGGSMEFEFPLLEKVYLVRALPVRNERGEVSRGMALGVDITERREQEAVRRGLLKQLMHAQEDERRRIARELHDELGQSLTAMMVGLRTLQQSATIDTAHEIAAQLGAVASETIANMGRLARGLHPTVLDDHGLRAALERYVADFSSTHGIPVDLHANGFEIDRLPTNVEAELYRIVIEALTNIARHSSATRASVFMWRSRDEISVVVEDDGQGFDAGALRHRAEGASRMGLDGMRERASLLRGTARIDSTPGRGTTIVVRVPTDAVEGP